MNWMPVVMVGDRAKAEPVRQRLQQAGLAPRIDERPPLSRLWWLGKQSQCVRVEVVANQFEEAENTLLQWDGEEGLLREAIRCPECGSLRVEYPQYARRSLLTNLAMGILARLGAIDWEYYCDDCHYTWPREGFRPGRERPHAAPYYFMEGVEQSRAQRRAVAPGPEQQRKAA
jgi:hypothetical protein